MAAEESESSSQMQQKKKKKCELISAKGQGCKHNQIQNAIDNNKEIRVKALKSIRGSAPLYGYAKCWLVKKSVFTNMLSCIDGQKLGTMKMFKKTYVALHYMQLACTALRSGVALILH